VTPPIPPVVAGQVLQVEEPDYLPGVGPLRLRVTAVGLVERHADGWWLNLRGMALQVDGTVVNARERYVLVRVDAVQHTRGREEIRP
jgi:hypothetical protein